MRFSLKQMKLASTLVLGLGFVSAVNADVIGECAMTGYSYIAGFGDYVCTPDKAPKDYFTACSLTTPMPDGMSLPGGAGNDAWGYGWVKFDTMSITESVDHAYLNLERVDMGLMGSLPDSENVAVPLHVYNPGDIDVADLAGNLPLKTQLKDNLKADGVDPIEIMTPSHGVYSIDITDIYNTWIADPANNKGLIVVTPGVLLENQKAAKYAGFGYVKANGEAAMAPNITTSPVPVPEPATLCLLAIGGVMLLRRKHS